MSTHLHSKHEFTSSSGSSSGPTETATAQMNLPISTTKTGLNNPETNDNSLMWQLSVIYIKKTLVIMMNSDLCHLKKRKTSLSWHNL